MGIRGLTTFIQNHSDRFFKDFELHDTYLVVDGNSLALQSYKFHCECNDCFGGDYDKYQQKIEQIFKIFEECNITPLVIFDGGFENRKLKTHYDRLKSRIETAGQLTSATENGIEFFPLLIRFEFRKILAKLNIKRIQCDFEADVEVSSIARILNCPVLSYDSDFYVSNVQYIPFSKLEIRSQRKNSYKFMPCQMYCSDSFLQMFNLDITVLPLLGVLLGNDYIHFSEFKNVFNQMKTHKQRSMQSPTQKRIYNLLKWLEGETYDSAIKKVLSKCKQNVREHILQEIKCALQGYITIESKMLHYLNVNIDKTTQVKTLNIDINKLGEDMKVDFNKTSDDGILTDEEKAICNSLPSWFFDKYRKCEYPAPFIDYIVKSKHFSIPQIENYDNQQSEVICHPIISAVFTILTSGQREQVIFIARFRNDYKNYVLEKSLKCLPTLEDLPKLTKEESRRILIDILYAELSEEVFVMVDKLPSSWQLYFITLVYWAKNASPEINKAHIYSILLCLLVIQVIDTKIGMHRSMKLFENLFKKQNLDELECETTSEYDIPKKEAFLCMKDLIEEFYTSPKLLKNHKQYDIYIIDAFAQFQACTLNISDLNSLLFEPFEPILAGNFYNGTFVYNICSNLLFRSDIDNYMNLLLKSSPGLLNSFNTLVDLIMDTVAQYIKNHNRKRRRKKKRSRETNVLQVQDILEKDGSSQEEFFDTNNRFCMLNKNK